MAGLPSSLGNFRELAISVLSEVIAAPGDSLIKLGEASYVHPNGFEKLVCTDAAPESPKIRLHVWPSTAIDAQTHDHGWSFYSHILLGSISSTEYELGAEPGEHSIYRVPNLRHHKAGVNLKCIRKNASLRTLSERVLRSGEGYGLTPNQLHRVAVSCKSGAITLVLQSPHTKAYSRVALPHGQVIGNAYPEKKFSGAAFVERLIAVRELLVGKAA